MKLTVHPVPPAVPPLRAARRPLSGSVLWRRLSIAALAMVLGVAAVYLALCVYMANVLTMPERTPFTRSPEQLALAYETVSFPSRVDHVPLAGWLLAAPNASQRPVVVVHGKGGDRQNAASGSVMDIAAALTAMGHPVLLFDLRGSGQSGGNHFTLGAQEVRDVGGAIDFLQQRGLAADGVDLLAYSMGAATALLAAPHEPLVRAVVEDSGYADLGDILNVQVPRASGLPSFFTPGVVLMARGIVGIDAYAIRPIDSMPVLAARHVPLLVIHGEADSYVPVSNGHRLADAYGAAVQTFFVPGAEHTESYKANPHVYLARLAAFLGGTQA